MMKSISMNLTKEDLKGILTEYFKEQEKEDVRVEVKIIKVGVGYRDDDEVDQISVTYTKNETIMNHTVSISVTYSQDEIKGILSQLIGNYEVSYIFVNNPGITLNLKEKQQTLERRCSYDFR